MADEALPTFESPRDEIEFWKRKFKEKTREMQELEETFSEFQESSKDLEAEMEKELERNEKQLKDITSAHHRLKQEHEDAIEKSRRVADESTKMSHGLQDELEKLKKVKVELQKEKTRLEQENDNLERRERELTASVQDLTDKVNKLMEENAWLQTELEEQTHLSQEMIQRSKEELRDLKLEMSLTDRRSLSGSSTDLLSSSSPPSSFTSSLGTSPPVSSSGLLSNSSSSNGSPTGAAGTTAATGRVPYMRKLKKGSIALVDDMLNLVKDMEKRLQLPLTNSHLDTASPVSSSLLPSPAVAIEELSLSEQTVY